MKQTAQMIGELARCFKSDVMPRDICVTALESLVRLAISEHVAAPILDAKADIERVDAIRAASRL